jgi:2-polyprenyl-3-methyl-5-hydroxy-6-metoxy-1,4-benzoquinol methylase
MRSTESDGAVPADLQPDVVTASEDYARRFRGSAGRWMLRVQERAVTHGLDPDRSIAILDIGGGHRQLAEPLSRLGYRVTVHGSTEACRARLDACPETRGCPFVASRADALPVADRAFHTVVSVRMLAHFDAWESLVAEMCRVADRRIIVDYPAITGLNRIAPALFQAKQRYEKNTRHWLSYAGPELEEAFRRHGFTVTSRYAQFCLPMVLHRMLRCGPLSALLEGACRLLGLTRHLGTPVVLCLDRKGDAPDGRAPTG